MTFYVYEHWRPDKDLPFYIGKGKGGRAYIFRRNRYYNRIVKKLSRLGMCVEVRMVRGNLSEAAALSLEIERIAFWRVSGISLTNKTNGGEGTSGLKLTVAHREKIGAAGRGRRASKETRAKMSIYALNRSPEHLEKISIALKGRPLSEEHRAKLANAQKKRSPILEVTRIRMSAAQQRRASRSDETKAKTSASITAWHARRAVLIEG